MNQGLAMARSETKAQDIVLYQFIRFLTPDVQAALRRFYSPGKKTEKKKKKMKLGNP